MCILIDTSTGNDRVVVNLDRVEYMMVDETNKEKTVLYFVDHQVLSVNMTLDSLASLFGSAQKVGG